MQKRDNIRLIAFIAVLFFTVSISYAQDSDALGTFTPYSLFGIGDVNRAGSSFNKSMGGLGIGINDNSKINILNPASYSERDTLMFMLDFGMDQKNLIISGNSGKTGYNVLRMHHLILSLPLYRNSAFAIGVTPYSSVGYKFEERENNPEIINQLGEVRYQRYGMGGINRAFFGISQKLFNKLYLGIEGIYYFGAVDRYSDILFLSNPDYRKINSGVGYVISSITGKAGMQYRAKLSGEREINLGLTWLLGSKLSGDLTKYSFATNAVGVKDTVYYNVMDNTMMEIPSELGVGLSFIKKDKWLIGVDYIRQNWSDVRFLETPGVEFLTALSNKINCGFEYTPNKYDIRYYFKRVTYRGGAYYEQSYMKIGADQINSFGLTAGATFPFLGIHNGMGISVDIGQRGSLKNRMVRERYIMFNLSVSLADRWFYKYRYE